MSVCVPNQVDDTFLLHFLLIVDQLSIVITHRDPFRMFSPLSMIPFIHLNKISVVSVVGTVTMHFFSTFTFKGQVGSSILG